MHSSESNKNDASANFVNNRKTVPSSAVPSDAIAKDGPPIVPSPSSLPEHQVDFAELDDGTLIETIEDSNDAAKSIFAVYKNGIVEYTAR